MHTLYISLNVFFIHNPLCTLKRREAEVRKQSQNFAFLVHKLYINTKNRSFLKVKFHKRKEYRRHPFVLFSHWKIGHGRFPAKNIFQFICNVQYYKVKCKEEKSEYEE